MDSAIVAALISGVISLVGYCITRKNTGKQLEDHKKYLEARGKAFEETLNLFELVNTVAINLSDGPKSLQIFEDEYIALDTKHKQRSIFIPDTISQKIGQFIYDLGKYTDCLSSKQDLGKDKQSIIENKGQDDFDPQQEKLNDNDVELRNKLTNEWVEIRDLIKEKFEMFN